MRKKVDKKLIGGVLRAGRLAAKTPAGKKAIATAGKKIKDVGRTLKKAFEKKSKPKVSKPSKLESKMTKAEQAKRAKIRADVNKRSAASTASRNKSIGTARKKVAGVTAGAAGAASFALPAGSKQKGYTIKRGDTLSQIAKKQGITLKAIKEANKGIKDLNKIQAGQKIKLPSKPKSKDPYAGMTKSEMAKLDVKKKLGGGMVRRMKAGGMPMKKVDGKSVPAFAADGKGSKDLLKKLGGGMVKKKMAGGMVKKKMAGGMVKKKMAGGMVKKKMAGGMVKKKLGGGRVRKRIM